MPHRVPVSAYRLQFNRDFKFTDAAALAGYLDALGVTDIYASPYFKAQPGSRHGYDITDHQSLNPEVGSDEDFQKMSAALQERGMGQIIDIVPNHMSIAGAGNAWWADVLENGQASPFASFFDIDWRPLKEELLDKVTLPILGGQYGDVLEGQELTLQFKDGEFRVCYYQHRLPVDPSTYPQVLEYRLDSLRDSMGAESTGYQEVLSIITSLKNFATPNVGDPALISERLREKEIAKKRLQRLYGDEPAFRDFIDHNVRAFNGEPGVHESFDLLDGLLGSQVYRLSFWRVATEEINYRRFFDINDLGAIRVEDERVFKETHRLVFDLIRRGMVQGIRVDHPDGLKNPREYFKRLQEGCFVAMCQAATGDGAEAAQEEIRRMYRERKAQEPRSALNAPFYVIGEKILMDGEGLPEDWPIAGTTGYDFMNSVNGLFVDAGKAAVLDRTYARFTRLRSSYHELFYRRKKLIMQTTMSSEINVLGRSLNRISEQDRHYRDFTLNNLTDAIVEVIAFFPVYRTYISEEGVSEDDGRYVRDAVRRARGLRRIPAPIFDFLQDVLLLRYPREGAAEGHRAQCMDFTMKFQQLTGPAMAKGVEDTVFYTYNRLISLNEVGGNPERFGTPVSAFHVQNIERQTHWPHALLCTSTHDSKRSEDVRARINVISELAPEWKECIIRWARMNKKFKRATGGSPAPDRNEEYLLYQTLLGTWPFDSSAEGHGTEDYAERISSYVVKAAREAKLNSNWLNPDTGYEEALKGFVGSVLSSEKFVDDFRGFQRKVAHYGIFNSLSQTLLKIAAPGVPDLYQGTELWNLRLVDPDNRMPVDFKLRSRLLAQLQADEAGDGRAALARELMGSPEDGRLKLFLTYAALNFRREHGELFSAGEYVALRATGDCDRNIVAFGLFSKAGQVLAVAPRLLVGVVPPGTAPLGDVWGETALCLPEGKAVGNYVNVLTGEKLVCAECDGAPALMMRDVFSTLPVALIKDVP